MDIKLSRNNIKSLCKLQSNSLNYLDFSHNKISGGLDSFFGSQLPKLLTIRLSNNSLEGSLPKMPNFPSLKTLDLSKNTLVDL